MAYIHTLETSSSLVLTGQVGKGVIYLADMPVCSLHDIYSRISEDTTNTFTFSDQIEI